MEAKNNREELATLVGVTLDRTGINAVHNRIDKVIPNSILNKYNPKDVVEVALEHGFSVEICPTCPALRVNGKWVQVEMELLEKADSQKSKFHNTCYSCYARYSGIVAYNFD